MKLEDIEVGEKYLVEFDQIGSRVIKAKVTGIPSAESSQKGSIIVSVDGTEHCVNTKCVLCPVKGKRWWFKNRHKMEEKDE